MTFEETLTSQDSLEVAALVDQYFHLVMEEKQYEAASMLYLPSTEYTNGEPTLLDNDQLHKVVAALKSIPVEDYEIEYMKFDSEVHNEVLCKVILTKGHDGKGEVATKMAFCPVRYLGYWVLCLDDFESGTSTLEKNSLRDSLRRAYEERKMLEQSFDDEEEEEENILK